MGQRGDLPVETCADPYEDLRPHYVEAALEQIESDRQGRQYRQRRDAAAGQCPVVDLHHVEGAGQGRSEERRVGKEGRSRGWQDDAKQNSAEVPGPSPRRTSALACPA